MYVDVQPQLPLVPSTAVSARLTILATPDGPASVHWSLLTVPGEEQLALGAALRTSYQDAAQLAELVLAEVLRVLPTLVDPPPFD